MSGGSVLVVGSINEDVILRVPKSPAPGETLTASGVSRRPGGKGANQAAAAAAAGAAVQLLGRVGDDAAGTRMLDALGAADVGAELVAILPGVATGAAYITVTPDGENTIVLDPGANVRLSPADIEASSDALASAAVMLAQLEVPIDSVTAAVQLANGSGVRPVVTLSPAQAVPAELLRGLDPLLVNRPEVEFVLDDPNALEDAEAAVRRLLELGPRSAVITLGADGVVFADRSGVSRLPAEPAREVVDTTGAGDAFAGALAAALAGGGGLDDGVRAGLIAGAAAVGRPGAR